MPQEVLEITGSPGSVARVVRLWRFVQDLCVLLYRCCRARFELCPPSEPPDWKPGPYSKHHGSPYYPGSWGAHGRVLCALVEVSFSFVLVEVIGSFCHELEDNARLQAQALGFGALALKRLLIAEVHAIRAFAMQRHHSIHLHGSEKLLEEFLLLVRISRGGDGRKPMLLEQLKRAGPLPSNSSC